MDITFVLKHCVFKSVREKSERNCLPFHIYCIFGDLQKYVDFLLLLDFFLFKPVAYVGHRKTDGNIDGWIYMQIDKSVQLAQTDGPFKWPVFRESNGA